MSAFEFSTCGLSGTVTLSMDYTEFVKLQRKLGDYESLKSAWLRRNDPHAYPRFERVAGLAFGKPYEYTSPYQAEIDRAQKELEAQK